MDDRRAFSSSSAPLQSSISHMSSDSIPTSVFNYDLQTNSVLGHIINPSFASDQKRRNNGNPQLNLPSQHQPGQIILINYFWALSLSPTAAQYPTTKVLCFARHCTLGFVCFVCWIYMGYRSLSVIIVIVTFDDRHIYLLMASLRVLYLYRFSNLLCFIPL